MSRVGGALTPRGAGLLAVGALLVVAGAASGLGGLLRAGTLLAALPLLSLVLGHLGRPRLEVERTLAPERVGAGEAARVRLRLRTTGWLPPHHLRAEDARDPALGRPSRFVVERGGAGGWTTVTYSVRPTRRGRHVVGPLRASAVDPLGLVRGLPAAARPVGASTTGASTTGSSTTGSSTTGPDQRALLVLPVVEELPPLPAGTAWAGAGARADLALTSTGEQSVGAREYRSGDYVRRVHWRATARAGRLMVRQEEEPLEDQAVVLLDTGPAAWRAPHDFERAVSAAASVVALLGAGGAPVQLVFRRRATTGTADQLLDALAVLAQDPEEPSGAGAVPFEALGALGRGSGAASVVAVLGDVGGGSVLPVLAPLPQRGVRASALLVAADGATGGDAAPRTAARSLRAAGWSVTEVAPGEALAAAWLRLGEAHAAERAS